MSMYKSFSYYYCYYLVTGLFSFALVLFFVILANKQLF